MLTDKEIEKAYNSTQGIDAIFNFLTAVGVIAFAGAMGYLWARYMV